MAPGLMDGVLGGPSGSSSSAAAAARAASSSSSSPTATSNRTKLDAAEPQVVEVEEAAKKKSQAPVILWVSTEKTDAAAVAALAAAIAAKEALAASNAAAKRRNKSTVNNQHVASAAGLLAAKSLTLPDNSEAAPCVVRIPLTAEQESYVEGLMDNGLPLTLHFRRTLRPGCPNEWEDLNASYFDADIPVMLTPLSEPGSLHLTAAVPLTPATYLANAAAAAGGVLSKRVSSMVASDVTDHERAKKRTNARRNKQFIPSTLFEDVERAEPHPYVESGTTAVVSLTLQRTLTRLASDRVRPNVLPSQLIPTRRRSLTSGGALKEDISSRLTRALQSMMSGILREMRAAATAVPPVAAGANTEQPNSLSHSSSGLPTAAYSPAWRSQFLSLLQSTGQLEACKQQLEPLVAELVQDRMNRGARATAEELARAKNELYVQLIDLMHLSLRSSLESSQESGWPVEVGPDEQIMGADAAAATGAPPPTDEVAIDEAAEDDEMDVQLRRAMEAQVSGEVALATKYYQSRIAVNTNDAAFPSLWMDMAMHYLRIDDMTKAEHCYREAIACNPRDITALLDYGIWLMANNRLSEAAVYLHSLADIAPQHRLGWGCVALLADLYGLAVPVDSPTTSAEQAKWIKEQRYALRRAALCGGSEDGGEDGADQAAVEEEIHLDVAAYILQLHHQDLANVSLARCRPGEERVEMLYGILFKQAGQYEEALKTLDGLEAGMTAVKSSDYPMLPVAEQQSFDERLLLRAECCVALGRSADAVRCYKDVLCRGTPAAAPPYLPSLLKLPSLKDSTSAPPHVNQLLAMRTMQVQGLRFITAYLQLGNLLIAEGRYKDALGAFTVAIQLWPRSALMWLGAGVALYRTGDLMAAEECLQESNILNPMNPRNWAYLALLNARLQHVEVEDLVQQVVSLDLADAALWAELGRTLLQSAKYPQLSAFCLRKAVQLCGDDAGASSEVSSPAVLYSAKFHLSHALMDLQHWDEAERLLIDVSSKCPNEVLKAKAEEELLMLHGH